MERLVRETIDFKRGISSKASLGIGSRALKIQTLEKWMYEKRDIPLLGYYSDWYEDSYIDARIDKISGQKIFFTGSYEVDDSLHKFAGTYTILGDFDVDNIQTIESEEGEESIVLKNSVETSQ